MHSTDDQRGDSELQTLRALVAEKEQAIRRSQERINDFERDWLYTSCRNFRGTLARMKSAKASLIGAGTTLIALLVFGLGLATALLLMLLRMVGIGRKNILEVEPHLCRVRVGLTDPLPESVVAAKGNSFLVGGWAYHPSKR
ncbi:MAG: hypothetical protein K1X57_16515, partial [Gemmataceae bacterium]|nr:hypothetical protein [Gemmataceae bacterium]